MKFSRNHYVKVQDLPTEVQDVLNKYYSGVVNSVIVFVDKKGLTTCFVRALKKNSASLWSHHISETNADYEEVRKALVENSE